MCLLSHKGTNINTAWKYKHFHNNWNIDLAPQHLSRTVIVFKNSIWGRRHFCCNTWHPTARKKTHKNNTSVKHGIVIHILSVLEQTYPWSFIVALTTHHNASLNCFCERYNHTITISLLYRPQGCPCVILIICLVCIVTHWQLQWYTTTSAFMCMLDSL